ncbi:MAG TPA: DUF3150 domain-containing protein [Rhodanobacteraceae bacterium]
MNMDTHSVVEKLNLIHVEVTCPSGAVSKTDKGNRGADVFTDGTVRYIDRKLLAPFTTARNAIARICRGVGTSFLGQWAIPDERLSETEVEISKVIDGFNAEKQKFDSALDANLHDWLHAHPEIQPYESRFPKDTEIVAGIGIHAAVYKIDPANSGLMSSVDDNAITHAVGGLSAQVLHEVAQDAKESFTKNATEATPKARNVLERIEKKLRGLMFVDTKLASVADTIGSVLAYLPSKGKITGVPYAVYSGVMHALMDPSTVISLCESSRPSINGGDWSAFGVMPVEVKPVVLAAPEAPVALQPYAVDEIATADLDTDPAATTDADVAALPPPPPAAQHSYGDWSW